MYFRSLVLERVQCTIYLGFWDTKRTTGSRVAGFQSITYDIIFR